MVSVSRKTHKARAPRRLHHSKQLRGFPLSYRVGLRMTPSGFSSIR
jgi:hypothetical protein